MFPDFNFDGFLKRLRDPPFHFGKYDEPPFDAIQHTCRWVSGSGRYCFGNKPEDDPQLLSLHEKLHDESDFLNWPTVRFYEVFCEMHARVADSTLAKEEAPKDESSGEEKRIIRYGQRELVLWKPVQILTFGAKHEPMTCEYGDAPADFSNHIPEFKPETREVLLKPAKADETGADAQSDDRDGWTGDEDHGNDEGEKEVEDQNIPCNDIDDESSIATEARDPKHKTSRPSTLSPRAKRATRRERDECYFGDVKDNAKAVINLLNEPWKFKLKAPGYVYAVRDPELKLVKIGFTRQAISARLSRLQSACKPGAGLEIIAGDDNEPIAEVERLEALLHQDLQPHRWFFHCPCGKKKNTRHIEYFDITNDVAKRTLKLWKDFMLRNPYGKPNDVGAFPLLDPWYSNINGHKLSPVEEKHEEHDKRLARWAKLLYSFHSRKPAADVDEKATTLPKRSRLPESNLEDQGSVARLAISVPEDSAKPAVFTAKTGLSERLQAGAQKASRDSPTPEGILGVPESLKSESTTVPKSSTAPGATFGLFGKAEREAKKSISSTHQTQEGNSGASFGWPGPRPKSGSVKNGSNGSLPFQMRGESYELLEKTAGEAGGAPRTGCPSELRGDSSRAFEKPATESKNASRTTSRPQLREGPTSSGTSPAPHKPNYSSQPAVSSHTNAVSPENGHPEAKSSVQQTPLTRRADEQSQIEFGSERKSTYGAITINLGAILDDVSAILNLERSGLNPRSIRNDLIQFRWPLAYAATLAVLGLYVPPIVALLMWCFFLPFFVAELRSWFLIEPGKVG